MAGQVRNWLKVHRISVAMFASQIVNRSQGTLSSLLNKPPETIPIGAGGEPWRKMEEFLDSGAMQESLIKGMQSIQTSTRLVQKCYQSMLFSLETSPGSSSNSRKTGEKREKPSKSRKLYTNAELASLDTVFEASDGNPTQAAVESLSKSLGVDASQVIFMFLHVMQLTFWFGLNNIVKLVQKPSCFNLMRTFHRVSS